MSRWKSGVALTTMTVTAIAVTACGTTTATSDEPSRDASLVILTSDPRGSLEKTMDTARKTETLKFVLTSSEAGRTVEMQGSLDLRDPGSYEMITTSTSVGGPPRERRIGAVVYYEVPEADRPKMGGKRWMKADLSPSDDAGRMEINNHSRDVDPFKRIKALRESEGVAVVGEETVNGIPTVRYTVTLPIEDHYGLLYDDKFGVESLVTSMVRRGVTEVRTDLWVDGQYRARRSTVALGELSKTTVDYTDYNTPVNIAPPPPGETGDFQEMLQELQDHIDGS